MSLTLYFLLECLDRARWFWQQLSAFSVNYTSNGVVHMLHFQGSLWLRNGMLYVECSIKGDKENIRKTSHQQKYWTFIFPTEERCIIKLYIISYTKNIVKLHPAVQCVKQQLEKNFHNIKKISFNSTINSLNKVIFLTPLK